MKAGSLLLAVKAIGRIHDSTAHPFYRGHGGVASRNGAGIGHNRRIMNNAFLPEPLPDGPFAIFAEWFDTAHGRKAQPNPNAMVLATVDARGAPQARVVLCKHLVSDPGYVVFFTNYQSHKGEQLIAHPRATVVFHWDALHRQVRMSGPVVKSPDAESDAYFQMRPVGNRIGAWASKQSQPLASRAQLAKQVTEIEQRFGVSSKDAEGHVPRPPHWGGFRLWPESVELWIEGPGRVHDRAVWNRAVTASDAFSFNCSSWSSTRLNP
jgi:pyridoxamine 5'-phosphate oxidase